MKLGPLLCLLLVVGWASPVLAIEYDSDNFTINFDRSSKKLNIAVWVVGDEPENFRFNGKALQESDTTYWSRLTYYSVTFREKEYRCNTGSNAWRMSDNEELGRGYPQNIEAGDQVFIYSTGVNYCNMVVKKPSRELASLPAPAAGGLLNASRSTFSAFSSAEVWDNRKAYMPGDFVKISDNGLTGYFMAISKSLDAPPATPSLYWAEIIYAP